MICLFLSIGPCNREMEETRPGVSKVVDRPARKGNYKYRNCLVEQKPTSGSSEKHHRTVGMKLLEGPELQKSPERI